MTIPGAMEPQSRTHTWLPHRFAHLVGVPRRLFEDSQHRNGLFLLADQALLGGTGMVFWLLAARHLPAATIGIATAVLGVASLAGMLATLGLPTTLLRYWGEEDDPAGMAWVALTVVGVAGLVLGLVWVTLARSWGVPSVFAGWSQAWLVAAVCAGGVGTVATYALMGRRQAQLIAAKDLVGIVVKLVGLGVVVAIGVGSATGVVAAAAAGAVAAAVGGAWACTRSTPQRKSHDWMALAARLRVRSRFALGNHLASCVATVPLYLLPAILVARMGATQAAYAAVALLIVAALNAIPQSTSNALLAETSHMRGDVAQTRRTRTLRAVRSTYVLAVPVVALTIVLARPVLSFFGPAYAAHGTTCMQIMAGTVLVACANYLSDTYLLILQEVRVYVVVNILGTVAVMGWVIYGSRFGPTGVGLGWMAGQANYLIFSVLGLVAVGGRAVDGHALPESKASTQ